MPSRHRPARAYNRPYLRPSRGDIVKLVTKYLVCTPPLRDWRCRYHHWEMDHFFYFRFKILKFFNNFRKVLMNVQKDCIRMNSDNGRIVVYFSTQLLVDFSLRSWCLDIYIYLELPFLCIGLKRHWARLLIHTYYTYTLPDAFHNHNMRKIITKFVPGYKDRTWRAYSYSRCVSWGRRHSLRDRWCRFPRRWSY